VADNWPPTCPRCGTNANVRVVPGARLPSCRWCAWEFWWRQLERDARRLIAEAERITREAA
jgi:hypothetical protein